MGDRGTGGGTATADAVLTIGRYGKIPFFFEDEAQRSAY